jgi:outer membrane protein OmpA-like peptidoglycan-associated protein
LLFLNNIQFKKYIKRLLISTAFFSLLPNQTLFSQNLIPFGHFEGESFQVTEKWKQPAGEYFHYQIGGNDFIAPRSGVACNGVCLIGGAPTEYLQVELNEVLEAGQTYQLSFYARGYSLRYIHPEKLDSVGVLFCKGPRSINSRTEIHLNPQVKFQFDITKPFAEWQQFNFSYTAIGGEDHMVLGRFYKVSEVDNDLLQEVEIELEALNNDFYAAAKSEMNETYMGAIPGMKISKRQRKKEEGQVKRQLIRYRTYTSEKKRLENKLIQIYSQYKGLGNGQTYQVRLYFDDFCLTNEGENCPELPLFKMPQSQKNGFEETIQAGDTIVLNNVYFDLDEAVLLEESYAELNLLNDILVAHPTMEISIEGHTDNQGELNYNQTLSSERAMAVKDFLLEVGINESRLYSIGFGEEKPIETNETEQGRAKNRRVEVIILKP